MTSVSKSERIQELVQLMKAGEMSKSELFVQLSALQKSSKSSTAHSSSTTSSQEDNAAMSSSEGGLASASSNAAVAPPVASNPERRAQIIQRLFDEKKRQRLQSLEQVNDEDLPKSASESVEDGARTSMQQGSSTELWAEGSRVSTQSLLLAEQEVSMSKQERERIAQVRQRQQELLLAQHAKRSNKSATSTPEHKMSSNTTPSGAALSARAKRFQQELVKKQQSECTFSPEIHGLPEEYGLARTSTYEQGLSFQARVNRWKARKVEEIERRRIEMEEAELQGCTFTPKINRQRGSSQGRRPGTPQPQKRNGATPTSYSNRPMTPDGRSSSRDQQDSYSVSSQQGAGSAYLRLYENSKVDRRAELQRQFLAAEEAKLAQECTFKPDIGKQPFAVRSRYMEGSPRNSRKAGGSSARPNSAGPGGRRVASQSSDGASSAGSSSVRRMRAWDQDLTFSPQTNPIHPNMQAAQVYLRKDIVTRLTLPRGQTPKSPNSSGQGRRSKVGASGLKDSDENAGARGNHQERTFDDKEDRVIDVSTFLSSSAHNGGHFQARADPNMANTAANDDGDAAGKSKPKLTPEQAAARRKSFDQFLVRQQQQEVRKQRKIDQTAKQIAQTHQPELCKKSVEIFNQRQQGGGAARNSNGGGSSFLDRVARGALKKEHDALRRKSQNDPECTFAPRINDKSRRKPARSALEMSRGDSLKKETKARLIKLRREQEESQDLTFSPQLETAGSQVASKAQGRLKILTEPETYIRRLQHKSSIHSHKANKVAQEQEMKELEECTFRPQIHEAPNYVKRIVRSLALAKPAREEMDAKMAQNQRPDWR